MYRCFRCGKKYRERRQAFMDHLKKVHGMTDAEAYEKVSQWRL